MQFLCRGGQTIFYYGYEPVKLFETDGSWGNQAMLLWNPANGTVEPVATFHALRMVTSDWLDPKGGAHQVFPVQMNLPKAEQNMITVFAVKRPDQSWSLLVFNKDETRGARLFVGERCSTPWAHTGRLATLVDRYSAAQYRWQADGPNGHPVRNDPPVVRGARESAGGDTAVVGVGASWWQTDVVQPIMCSGRPRGLISSPRYGDASCCGPWPRGRRERWVGLGDGLAGRHRHPS